jgi:hypothetical protein
MQKYLNMSKSQLERAYNKCLQRGDYDNAEDIMYVIEERFDYMDHNQVRGGKREIQDAA